MKKTVIFISFFAFLSMNAQQTISVNQVLGDNSVFGGVKSESGKSLSYDEIKGSPYYDKNFYEAKVAENYEIVQIRYNTYKDEIEFQKDGKIQILPKQSTFSRVEMQNPKNTLVLLDSNETISGYFFELTNGKNILYKKIKTEFKDIVPAANSYATEKPASFKSVAPIYYIKIHDGNFIKTPKNQKDIIQSMSNKKEEISIFFKDNEVKFNKEEDLIKLVNFLNQIS